MYKNYGSFLIILVLFLTNVINLSAEEILTWPECVREAAKNHPDLISAGEEIKQSKEDRKITASSILPQIDSSVSASKTKTRTTTSGSTSSRRTDSYTYGVTGTQLLFDGFKTANDLKASSEDIKSSRYNYRFTSSEIRLRLRTAYINLLKTQSLLDITREIYDIRRGNLELINLLYMSGMEHKGALLEAEANLASADFEISQAERTLEVAQRELVKELGRSEFSLLKVEGSFSVSSIVSEKPDFEALAKDNPYLKKFTAQKNAAYYDIKSAQADFFPQLSAQAGANKNSSRWPPKNDQWNFGFTLSFPIFEGGLRFSEIAKAESLFNQARADERSARDSIVLNLQQAWAAFQDAVEKVSVQRKFLSAAQERSKIAEAQYSIGLIGFDNWTIIEDDLVKEKKAFLDAQADALFTEADWLQAKGETLEYAE